VSEESDTEKAMWVTANAWADHQLIEAIILAANQLSPASTGHREAILQACHIGQTGCVTRFQAGRKMLGAKDPRP